MEDLSAPRPGAVGIVQSSARSCCEAAADGVGTRALEGVQGHSSGSQEAGPTTTSGPSMCYRANKDATQSCSWPTCYPHGTSAAFCTTWQVPCLPGGAPAPGSRRPRRSAAGRENDGRRVQARMAGKPGETTSNATEKEKYTHPMQPCRQQQLVVFFLPTLLFLSFSMPAMKGNKETPPPPPPGARPNRSALRFPPKLFYPSASGPQNAFLHPLTPVPLNFSMKTVWDGPVLGSMVVLSCRLSRALGRSCAPSCPGDRPPLLYFLKDKSTF